MRMQNGKPIFQTKINGIYCYCRVDHYLPGIPNVVTGRYEDAEMGSDEEFEYTILDYRYIKAPWLEKQMDKQDEERLIDEYLLEGMAERHYKDI